MLPLHTAKTLLSALLNAYTDWHLVVGDSNATNDDLVLGSGTCARPADKGFPAVQGRELIVRASFGEDDANGAWNELAIFAMHQGKLVQVGERVVKDRGVKRGGEWQAEVRIGF